VYVCESLITGFETVDRFSRNLVLALRSHQRHTFRFLKYVITNIKARNCEAGSTLGPLTLGCVSDLRRIFGPKRDEVTRGWRKLHNEELNDFYSSPSIIRVIKSRRMRWVGHVLRMEREKECI
jgi:hypothetical protein